MNRRETIKTIGALASGAAFSRIAIGQTTRKYLMATGSVGGTFYPLGAAVAKIASQHAPGIEISIQSTGASAENCRLLGSQRVEFGLSAGSVITNAFNGKEPFTKAYTNLRAVGFIYPDVSQWLVRADSGIKSFQDMKGKRIGIGPVGSGAAIASRLILETAGLSPSDYEGVLLPFGQSADRIRDRQLDVANFFLAAPNSTVIDLTTMHEMRIVPIDGELRLRLQKDHADYVSVTIPGGTYKGFEQNIETVGWASGLFTREDIPADDVYAVTKAVYSHAQEIGEIHPAGRTIKIADIRKGITIPFHEGAQRFLKENGVG